MASKKKKIIDNATLINQDFLQPIFGGDSKAAVTDPNFNGHLHDDGGEWGHAPKIDLSKHTTGRVLLQDIYSVSKAVSAYPSIIATQNNIISGTLLNVPNSTFKSNVALTIPVTNPYNNANANFIAIDTNPSIAVSGVLGTISGSQPNLVNSNVNGELDGKISVILSGPTSPLNISSPDYPFTVPNIVTSAIWYFQVPLDMDVTKKAYFSFAWMGDILTTDGFGNTILDTTKLSQAGSPVAQTTTFRVTWQWFTPGYSVFPPAVIFDGYVPSNIVGSNTNANTLTRGRISNLTVNALPFSLLINDSSSGNQNYINLTGLQQATGAVMLGVQVDVLNTGFANITTDNQSGHLKFYQGNFVYLSKTMGGADVTFNTF